MSPDTVARWLTALEPVLRDAAYLVLVLVLEVVRRHVKNRDALAVLDEVAGCARQAVAEVYQGAVKGLKDPSLPGAWDDKAKAGAKLAAVDTVHRMAPGLVARLAAIGRDSDAVVSSAIERAVVELNTAVPARPETPTRASATTVPPPGTNGASS